MIRVILCCTPPKIIENKDHSLIRGLKYAVFKIWNQYNILEDIKRGPYSKKSPIRQYSEEEKAEAMAKTIEEYMSKTRTDYGSGVARPKIDNKDQFELKGQFLKELRENTFSDSDNEDANDTLRNRNSLAKNKPAGSIKTWEDLKTKFLNKYCPPGQTAKKIEEINNFQQEPDETLYQACKRFKELLVKCPQSYLTEMQEVISFYNGLDVPTRHILDSREYSQKWHNGTSRGRSTKTSDGLAAIQAQLNNLGREIKKVNEKVYAAQVGCEQCKGPHYTKDCPQKEEGKTLEEAYYTQNITQLYKSRQTTVPFLSRLDNHYYKEDVGNYGPKFTKAYGASHINNAITQKEKDPGSFTLPCFINDFFFDNALVDLGARTVKYPKGIAKNVLVGIGKFTFPVDFIILDMPKDIKVPLILGRSFLSIARAKIDVYKRKITLRVGKEKIIFKSVKPASSIIKRVYMISLRERMELDLEARLMGETLVLNRSLDPFLEDYIKLNDLNEPFELKRNQGDDLMPTIEEGEVIEEFRTRDEDLDTGINDYPSYCDDDKKIHIDCAHNLKFSCMIGFEFTHANFFPLLYVNVMSKKFHNSIMKDKMVYKGNNVVGALMNVPIFVGTFSIMTDFAVLEDMDAYRDEGMGDVIFGEPFLREVGIKTKRFEGRITIYNGDDKVTYQMVRSHPRFKNHTNEQCNKIPPLLKVSEVDKKNGISHAYQKLKGFYKGVLNLGPNYIRDAKMEEWLTRRAH
ncbi:homeodomain-like protein [Tanacetum coccineum]